MSLVNFTSREITCKIVYYGPGRSGKTTNLQYVYDRVPESRRGRMVSLATQTDRTLFFDFLPLELGSISGFATKFQLYTVPGQSYYNATRKLVLQGADGVVFVADSQARRFDDNLESLQNLQDNLLTQGVDIRQLPVVFQYNKQDLPRDLILTHEEATELPGGAELWRRRLHGTGVFETLRGISELVLKRLAAGLSPDDRSRSIRCTASTPSWSARRTAWPSRRRRPWPRSPGTVYNPLFIYARPGLGKTHLLMGVGHAARAIDPNLHVEYLTLDEFVEAFHAAIAGARRGVPEAIPRRGSAPGGRRPVSDPPAGDAGGAAPADRRAADRQSPDRPHRRPSGGPRSRRWTSA